MSFIFLPHELLSNLKKQLQVLHKLHWKKSNSTWHIINVEFSISRKLYILSYQGCLVHRYWFLLFKINNIYEKLQTYKNIFYLEPNSKPNIDIFGITVSMWKQHNFETLFNSNDIMNIQYKIENRFLSKEWVYSMGLNTYFGPRWKYIPHATPEYGPGKYSLKLIITDKHIFLQKLVHIRKSKWRIRLRSNLFFEMFKL